MSDTYTSFTNTNRTGDVAAAGATLGLGTRAQALTRNATVHTSAAMTRVTAALRDPAGCWGPDVTTLPDALARGLLDDTGEQNRTTQTFSDEEEKGAIKMHDRDDGQ